GGGDAPVAQRLGRGGARAQRNFPPLVSDDCRWPTTLESPACPGQLPDGAPRHQCRRGRPATGRALPSSVDECHPCARRFCIGAGRFSALSILEVPTLAGRGAIGARGCHPRTSVSHTPYSCPRPGLSSLPGPPSAPV